MSDLITEYQLFKLLCESKKIQKAQSINELVEKIESKGLTLSSDAGSYFLNHSVIPLSEKKIRKGLSFIENKSIQSFYLLYETISTNNMFVDMELSEQYSVVMTEFQTGGQGRRDKKWISPLADNISLSIQFKLKNLKNAHFIPLITAIAICKSLKKIGIDGCKIKWPNDVYLGGKKLAGVLVESRYNHKTGSIFIVGIGLNVNMQFNNEIDQSWTSLRNEMHILFDRNIITSTLLSATLETYNDITNMNLETFFKEWKLYDYLYGCEVNITDDSKTYSSIAKGIADDGALFISHPGDETLKKIYSAEVSIKLTK